VAALGNQSSALVGKGLKHRGSDIAFFKSYLRKIFSRIYLLTKHTTTVIVEQKTTTVVY